MTAAATARKPPDAAFGAAPDPDGDPWDRIPLVNRLIAARRPLALSWQDRPRFVIAAGLAVAVVVSVGWWLGQPSSAGPVDGAIPFASSPTAGAGSPSGGGPSSVSTAVSTAVAPGAGPGPAAAEMPPAAEMVVHVAGAVNRPGIVRLAAGARVIEAIEAAGGAAGDADLDQLNLAAPLADGTQVRVPHQGETVPAPISPAAPAGGNGPAAVGPPPVVVDLNRATAAELDQLPGIGPALAAAIVTWRTDHGQFKRIDDLLDVPGIGPAKLSDLADRVRV